MQITSPRLGNFSYTQDQVIHFCEGLFGFETLREFVLVDIEEFRPFQWLVSIEEPAIALPLLDPLLAVHDYAPTFTKADLQGVELERVGDCALYCVTNSKGARPTFNLRGPIIINTQKRLGRQVGLLDERYDFRHPIPI